MRRAFVVAFLFAFCSVPALAQLLAPAFPPGVLIGRGALDAGGSPSYTGPGDVVSGATAWYGLRAYNAAYATGSNKAINIRRASDNTTTNIVILSNGNLDIATANTFAGTDATCQGSTTGLSTTIAFTSCSSTPNAADTVSGTGISQPESIVSCGSFVAGAGTCTLTTAQNIAVAETVTMQVAMFVTEAYDQSGNSRNILQATVADQPQLLPLCVNSLPCMTFVGATPQGLSGGTLPSQAVPWTMNGVAKENPTSGATEDIISTSGSFENLMGFLGTNLLGGNAGSNFSAAASTNNVWHAASFIPNTGTTGLVNIDGVQSTGTTGTNNLTARGTTINLGTGGSGSLTGSITEAGIWPSGFSSGNQTLVCKNQQAYYGAGNFGAAC